MRLGIQYVGYVGSAWEWSSKLAKPKWAGADHRLASASHFEVHFARGCSVGNGIRGRMTVG